MARHVSEPSIGVLDRRSEGIRATGHIPCITCGYDLFGSPKREGICTECGTSIRASLDPRRLFFVDQRVLVWLRAVLLLYCCSFVLLKGLNNYGLYHLWRYRRWIDTPIPEFCSQAIALLSAATLVLVAQCIITPAVRRAAFVFAVMSAVIVVWWAFV